MSIPTQMSLAGFIASSPELHFTEAGDARFYARIGVEHFRREVDGTFTKLDPSYHDLVLFKTAAEKAYDRFRPGDCFIASGYIHEYEVDRAGGSVIKEEFVARKIGHDANRTSYEVQRRRPIPAGQTPAEQAPAGQAGAGQTPPSPMPASPVPPASTPAPNPAPAAAGQAAARGSAMGL